MKTKMCLCKAMICLSVLYPASGLAAPPAAPTSLPSVSKLTLHPSALTGLPFRYRMLPDAVDLQPGNAASLYMSACTLMSGFDTKENLAALDETEDGPVDKIDRAKASKLLASVAALRLVELGARREYCHWDLPVREEGFSTLLPHLSQIRSICRLLSLQAKLQIADGKFDEAAHTIQTGLAIAKHLDSEGMLVQQLVGAATTELMLSRVEQWITTPGSPNIYWSITDLPTPFFDLRSSLRAERAVTYWAIPHLKEAVDGKLTPEHFREMSAKVFQLYDITERSPEIRFAVQPKAGENDIAGLVSGAKVKLLAMGYPDKSLGGMSNEQMVGLWWGLSYEQAIQDCTKALALPVYQDTSLMQLAGATESRAQADPLNPILQVLPSMLWARLAMARVDRRIGEMRCLEMIRAYAAAHENAAPGSLAATPGVPAPIDPLTGLPFQYRVDAGLIVIEAPVPAGGQSRHGWKAEIRLEK